ncbi:MAG: hypothetical protein A3F68_08440 [Acidobacteria bacterium RIFCSPLOWO2_12_FULL_54_10]|nr:MAG: hypothetical protein A3F68_08440 [Acidobacteria bacterium RIFCSPLOWO2_12_FULL_54_10]
MKATIRLLARGFQIAGALALVYCVVLLVWAEGFQAYANWAFQRDLGNSPVAAHLSSNSGPWYRGAKNRPPPMINSVIGRIEIPRLNLSTMILEGDGERQLLLGAGHIPGTGLPGDAGNTVIAAHRDTFFRPLQEIAENDEIVLTTLSGSFRYIVKSVEIADPDNTTVLQPSAEPALTLVTCYPFSFVGSAPKRFIVHARAAE